MGNEGANDMSRQPPDLSKQSLEDQMATDEKDLDDEDADQGRQGQVREERYDRGQDPCGTSPSIEKLETWLTKVKALYKVTFGEDVDAEENEHGFEKGKKQKKRKNPGKKATTCLTDVDAFEKDVDAEENEHGFDQEEKIEKAKRVRLPEKVGRSAMQKTHTDDLSDKPKQPLEDQSTADHKDINDQKANKATKKACASGNMPEWEYASLLIRRGDFRRRSEHRRSQGHE